MTPDQLARANNEHSHQRALFAWANMAAFAGFEMSWNDNAYIVAGYAELRKWQPVEALKRLYAIPNGGQRDKITAGKLKAEGVKRGVPDICLPLPVRYATPGVNGTRCIRHCGLYIEMKRPQVGRDQRSGVTSLDQNDWIAYLRSVGYAVSVCFDWIAAAKELQSYIEAGGKHEQSDERAHL